MHIPANCCANRSVNKDVTHMHANFIAYMFTYIDRCVSRWRQTNIYIIHMWNIKYEYNGMLFSQNKDIDTVTY